MSGLARSRDWDIVVAVEMPSLAGSALTRVSFYVLAVGEIEVVGTDGEPTVAADVLELLAGHATASLAPPLEARAVRTTDELWSVAARRTNRRPTDLVLPAGIHSISVARAPDGELTVHINGELTVEPASYVAAAIEQVVAVAEQEHDAFVASVEQFDSGRVALAIDAL